MLLFRVIDLDKRSLEPKYVLLDVVIVFNRWGQRKKLVKNVLIDLDQFLRRSKHEVAQRCE